MTGHEDVSTEVLLVIQSNLLKGLGIVAEHLAAGTFEVSKKEGAAPPSQSGCLTVILLLGIEDELEARILGFQRTIDPKLFERDNGVQEIGRDGHGRSSSSADDHGGSGRMRSEDQQPRRRSNRVAKSEVHGAQRGHGATTAAR